jgi:hypothetical protein
MTIETQRLSLKLQNLAESRAQLAAMSPEQRAQVSPHWLGAHAIRQQPDPWRHGFALVLCGNGARIGSAGFNSPPDAEGVVEIACASAARETWLGRF